MTCEINEISILRDKKKVYDVWQKILTVNLLNFKIKKVNEDLLIAEQLI